MLATAFTFSLAYGQGKPADTSLEDGKYTIRNANGSYLSNSYNSLKATSVNRYAASWLDIWHLKKADSVCYNIFVEDGKSFVWDLKGSKDKEGQEVQLYKKFNDSATQRWFFDRNDDGSFFIRTTNASGRVITAEKGKITIKENKNLSTQKWFIEKDSEERRAKIKEAKKAIEAERAAERAFMEAFKQAAAKRAAEAKKARASIKTFTDSRGKRVYKKVTIGTQTWMAQNLDYKGEDGELGKCYGNKAANCAKYGRLYDWEAAKTACPAGWHLPTDEEWKTLEDLVGIDEAGKEAKTAGALKTRSGWNIHTYCFVPSSCIDIDGNGNDSFGFSALPGGLSLLFGSFGGDDGDGDYGGVGDYSGWWSATESNSDDASNHSVDYINENVIRYDYDKSFLLSVRCVQD